MWSGAAVGSGDGDCVVMEVECWWGLSGNIRSDIAASGLGCWGCSVYFARRSQCHLAVARIRDAKLPLHAVRFNITFLKSCGWVRKAKRLPHVSHLDRCEQRGVLSVKHFTPLSPLFCGC